jgi:hypothetical protein
MNIDFSFSEHLDRYPPVIPRAKVSEYFPWLSQKRLANLDMLGEGPGHAFRNGGAVLYPTWAFLHWLDERTRPHGSKQNSELVHHKSESEECNPSKNNRRGRKTKSQEIRERRGQ